MLKLENVNVGYGYLQVAWDVSMEIHAGEVVAILGLNGAGKTSVLKTIAGIKQPMSGKITFLGEDVTGKKANEICEKGLSFIPEERNLFNAMTVRDNLLMGAYTVKDKKQQLENLDYVYGMFPRLQEREKQLVATMSGGERQMVAIARGLMSNPQLVILDEPSMGLSPSNVLIVFDAIKKLKAENKTVLIVEQNVKTTLKVANRAYIMDHGKISMEGSSEELLANEDIQKMYLGIE